VRDYRLYFMDDHGHIRSAEVLQAPDDETAISRAGQLGLGEAKELRFGARRVLRARATKDRAAASLRSRGVSQPS
jgi:hypothetical protein